MSTPSTKSLVIVDDEQSYTELLAQLLQEHLHCPIHSFSRPLAALEALPGLNPGLLVTDYYMPQINGVEFIRRVEKSHPDLPVIMITGHMMELEDPDHLHLPSLKSVLPKPFNWRQLADEVIRHWPEAAAPGHAAACKSQTPKVQIPKNAAADL